MHPNQGNKTNQLLQEHLLLSIKTTSIYITNRPIRESSRFTLLQRFCTSIAAPIRSYPSGSLLILGENSEDDPRPGISPKFTNEATDWERMDFFCSLPPSTTLSCFDNLSLLQSLCMALLAFYPSAELASFDSRVASCL